MLKKLCQCVGIASLILVVNYGELLGGGADVRMHVPFALTAICFAQIADILLLGLFLAVLIIPFQHTRNYPWVRLLVATLIPPYLLIRIRYLFPGGIEDGTVLFVSLAWIAALLLLRLRFPRTYKHTLQAASAICVFFGLFAITAILQLLWVATWKPGLQQHTANWSSTPQTPRQHPLLVWVIFDELSHDQVYEHRARDLNLPAFDELRSQSTLFTDVQPIGYYTRKIIPSLFTGKVVEDFRYDFANRFRVHYAGVHGKQPLTGSGTIFGDAKQAGYRTAAVGWYNPYCTIYGDAIDDCFWTNRDMLDGPMTQSVSVWRNILTPMQHLVRQVKAPQRADRDLCTFDVRQRYKTHIDLESHALQTLRTDQADFVFLHLAIPHSPNIWSRIDDNYTQFCDSSYLDNLALADREMHTIITILKASPRWNDTTLIVEGDHSWRVDTWDWRPDWTDEDDAASHDIFDTRPALVIHQPGQTQPQTVSAPWQQLNVHTLLEQAIHGQPIKF
jgi:hypothetical protein